MYPISERVNGQTRGWQWSRGGVHQGQPQHMCEVVAGAGAYKGRVGCMWDGGSTLRGGWACQRGQGASRGMGHVLGGHGASHRVSPSVGQFAWTRGWQRRCVVGVRTRAHKHGGHGQCDVVAATKQGKDVHVCVIIGGQPKLSVA